MVRLLVLMLALLALPLRAATWHVDPAALPAGADGREAAPWPDLAAAIASGRVAAGDMILLHDGAHGTLEISGRIEAGQAVRVLSVPGASPVLDRLVIREAAGWHVAGLTIRGRDAPSPPERSLVHVIRSTDILLEGLDIASVDDAAGWSREDWVENARDGIAASGQRVHMLGNRIRNVRFGIRTVAADSRIERNVIDTFSADGIRALGDRQHYLFNEIRTCVDVDDNHDDAFQAWSRGADGAAGRGVQEGVVLFGNLIENTPGGPFDCGLQGIGLFDGIYRDWLIANNIVLVNHWHGITVMGAENVRVVNNTVLDVDRRTPDPPWIAITHHKDGRPPVNSVIANNLTMPRPPAPEAFRWPKPGVTYTGNVTVPGLGDAFTFYAEGDLRLPAASPAVDAAVPRHAPSHDIFGRDRGGAPDAGAVERP